MSELGLRFDIHSLVQADMASTMQRTKLDVLDDALFLVCKLIFRDFDGSGCIFIEQICFYVKENLLITVQESPKKLFDSIQSMILSLKKHKSMSVILFLRSYSTK